MEREAPGGAKGKESKKQRGKTDKGAALTSVVDYGLAFDQNRKHRRKMEDEHIHVDSFCDTPGAGLFGIFDGHGGGTASVFCRDNFAATLSEALGAAGVSTSQADQALAAATDAAYAAVDVAMKPTVPYAVRTGSAVLSSLACY